MKKAAAEASMQRSKKARMVALFVVINHVMCLFSVLGGGVAYHTTIVRHRQWPVARNVMQKVPYVHVRILHYVEGHARTHEGHERTRNS